MPTDTITIWENEICSVLNIKVQSAFDYTNYTCTLLDKYQPAIALSTMPEMERMAETTAPTENQHIYYGYYGSYSIESLA